MRTCSSCSWTGRGATDAGTQAKRGAEEVVGWVDGRWMLCSAGHTHSGFINRGSVVLLPIGLDASGLVGRHTAGSLSERPWPVVVPRLPITRGGRMIRAMSRRPLVGVQGADQHSQPLLTPGSHVSAISSGTEEQWGIKKQPLRAPQLKY